MPKGKPKKKPYGQGFEFDFHGAYDKKPPAKAKAKKRKGFVLFRHIGRGWRYVVATVRAPF